MRWLIIGLISASLACPAVAQENEGEGDSENLQCNLSKNWRVNLNELPDAAGMIMDVNRRDPNGQPDCQTKDIKPDFTVGGTDQTLWFTALSADYLVMSRSTGPKSNVVIESLSDKTIVLDVVSDDSQTDSWGVTYWEHKEAGTPENCSDFASFKEQGFDAVITHEMRYDFATKTNLTSGMTNCEPAQ